MQLDIRPTPYSRTSNSKIQKTPDMHIETRPLNGPPRKYSEIRRGSLLTLEGTRCTSRDTAGLVRRVRSDHSLHYRDRKILSSLHAADHKIQRRAPITLIPSFPNNSENLLHFASIMFIDPMKIGGDSRRRKTSNLPRALSTNE